MSPPPRSLRAPAAHRALAAAASPAIGFFVARLLLRLTQLPAAPTYAVCLALACFLALRAWRARVELGSDSLRVHNTLASSTVHRQDIRRVGDTGRIEWRAGASRPTRLPSEALHAPWWTLRTGADTYAVNREQVRSWIRTPRLGREGDPAA